MVIALTSPASPQAQEQRWVDCDPSSERGLLGAGPCWGASQHGVQGEDVLGCHSRHWQNPREPWLHGWHVGWLMVCTLFDSIVNQESWAINTSVCLNFSVWGMFVISQYEIWILPLEPFDPCCLHSRFQVLNAFAGHLWQVFWVGRVVGKNSTMDAS